MGYRSIRARTAAWTALLSFAAATAGFAASSIPAGTEVPLEFAQSVSTKTAHKGDAVRLRVAEDVAVNGTTLIRSGAAAVGMVEDVSKPGVFGKRGKLKIRLTSVDDVHGKHVPLAPYTTGNRFTAAGPAASGAGLLILGPVGLVGGAFIKGKNVTIDQGTRIEARVK